MKKGEGIPLIYPELHYCGGYPPSSTKFEVLFKLHDKTVVRKKPYNITREKKAWLKEELAKMFDAGIIGPSVSPYASPITLAPKEDGNSDSARTTEQLATKHSPFRSLCQE